MQLSVVCPKIWGDGEIGHPHEIDQEGPLSRNFGIYVPPQGQEFDLAAILEGWVKLEIEVICHLRSYPTKFVYWNWYTISLDPRNGISIYNGYLWVRKLILKTWKCQFPSPSSSWGKPSTGAYSWTSLSALIGTRPNSPDNQVTQ